MRQLGSWSFMEVGEMRVLRLKDWQKTHRAGLYPVSQPTQLDSAAGLCATGNRGRSLYPLFSQSPSFLTRIIGVTWTANKYKVSPIARNRAAHAFFGLASLLIRQVLRNTLNGGILVSKLHRLIKNLCSDTWIHVLLLSVHCEGSQCRATARWHQGSFCFQLRNGHFLMLSTYSHKPAHLWSLDQSRSN